MSNALDTLYREVILDHYKNPRGKKKLDHADVKNEGKNPVCGDEIEVEVEFDLDEREKLKKRVFRIISWITGGVIIASLIISLIKFNNTLFWL